jgi:large conductance mechanosensitive channel
MSFLKDFKAFAVKGNLADVAIAFLMGTAFGKVVSSFVDGLISPILGILSGGTDFKSLKWEYKKPVTDAAGKVTDPGIVFAYGNFIAEVISFLMVAVVCYIVIKAVLKKDPNAAPAPSSTDVLLTEIRDALKK